MPIAESILNKLTCCFSTDGHIVIEPILFSIICGGNACKKCVIDSEEEAIKCFRLDCKLDY